MTVPSGYGPAYPSVWIAPDKDPARGWWVTLVWDAADAGQVLIRTARGAGLLAAIWRNDIARGTGLYLCPDCMDDGGFCERCHGEGNINRETLSLYVIAPIPKWNGI